MILVFILLLGPIYTIESLAQFESDNNGASNEFDDSEDIEDEEEAKPKKSSSRDSAYKSSETFTSKPAVTSEDIENLQKLISANDESGVVKQAAEMLGKDDAHLATLNLLGVFYYQNKKYGLAKLIFNRALKTHPEAFSIHNNLGIIYLAENDLQKAIESFNTASSFKANYDLARTNLGSIFIKYKDYVRALSPLEDSYNQLKPDLRRGNINAIRVANNYAIALMGVGENAKASKVFEALLETGERNPIIYLNYSMLLVEVLKKKNDALRVLSKLKFMTEDNRILKKAEELERKLSQL